MRSIKILQLGHFVFDSFSIRRASRIAGWLLLGLIAILSLSPASYRPVTQLGHYVEHFFIHVLVGLSFGIGYAMRWSRLALGLVALTGAIEIAQLFVPGRHARLRDFVIDAGAACLGIGLVRITNVVRSALAKASRSDP